ncbi:unnamed protein product [Prunus armeniaca]|uniref:Uncharacterized protein n=2 Tax=Prunus armeniaca TaxID=36596 RepID=A0A6J5XY70_PRUAR|nr:unnamed protein product [Prunus armeniaca]
MEKTSRNKVIDNTYIQERSKGERKRERMGFLSSICCCLHGARVFNQGSAAATAPERQPLTLSPNFVQTEAPVPILVPHFPVNSKLYHM